VSALPSLARNQPAEVPPLLVIPVPTAALLVTSKTAPPSALADPVYGGNRERRGWEWLAHQPGYPRPPPGKTWYRLAAPVHFQRKG
jgi:hypothetical protein